MKIVKVINITIKINKLINNKNMNLNVNQIIDKKKKKKKKNFQNLNFKF